ncbi:MAG: 50S ribosomal protein L18 [Candidatus Levybacteria bacterium RIFCSPHIGHO2_02_FULL_39_36]|nr:MAG: 50S ribosomal protein L18 [Candidatus Levybacteria bacterium GW2011_GWA1_39_11]KKR24986.1 MAG: 50S ribosomal protein L18 [Candidatus Levybacteria bacterium GW2011_GWB1_39_7]KKR27543.1 MAG: 50S ribosomal protein L18 [Microgenomates group bacterium GW2011_GWC1_39_7]KKR48409.1 MAG: 50S ribosomal protein L18 [Candidatus Levybacteria bacterium GW2011_GWA2_40_16]OGH15490.1 MAG: 50S ribosomal protein L18 [Candidatus Levybacteria bacterium RIFCSPHIGHO2_01_FULL_38_96]OGH25602.1 MAG: 50S ribosom
MREELIKRQKKQRRKNRIRKKISADKLRLTVFRSNKYIYAQIIDDKKGKTVLSASEKDLKNESKVNKVQKAEELGKAIAQKAMSKKIKDVVFDKGAYKYHGRVKALAEGARKGGLVF